MQYAVNAKEMAQYDRNTTEHFGVASLVLMERAALAVYERVTAVDGARRILCLAGTGNNGADALAVARLAFQDGYEVVVRVVGDETKATDAFQKQKKTLAAYGVTCAPFQVRDEAFRTADVIVDGLFGVGLTRELAGEAKEAVEAVNRARHDVDGGPYVIAVDLPSGIRADDGTVAGCAVQADETVTFGFAKIGHLLYPGAAYTGLLQVASVGITKESFLGQLPRAMYYGETDARLLTRRPDGNKATFGKILIIAGSPTVSGAALLAAQSCYRSGAGMVRVLTAKENIAAIQTTLPEALFDAYDVGNDEEDGETGDAKERLQEQILAACAWSTAAVAGPGIGTDETAKTILTTLLTNYDKPLILDADALTLLAQDPALASAAAAYGGGGKWLMLTPHLKEFSRLYGAPVQDCRDAMCVFPRQLAERYHATIVCKDARTIVADADQPGFYINTTGNCGMATAGSGDVLVGLLGALSARGMDAYHTACLGVYLHGRAGDKACAALGEDYMLAGDIVSRLQEVLTEAYA